MTQHHYFHTEKYIQFQTAPILCAGITMYSPLKNWGADKGKKTVGIIGIGGLGTMGIKLAKALGNEIWQFHQVLTRYLNR